jgi:hypothetical protein
MAYVNTSRIARKGFADRLVVAKDAVLAAFNQRRVYARTVAELNSLTDRELTDLGISRLTICGDATPPPRHRRTPSRASTAPDHRVIHPPPGSSGKSGGASLLPGTAAPKFRALARTSSGAPPPPWGPRSCGGVLLLPDTAAPHSGPEGPTVSASHPPPGTPTLAAVPSLLPWGRRPSFPPCTADAAAK